MRKCTASDSWSFATDSFGVYLCLLCVQVTLEKQIRLCPRQEGEVHSFKAGGRGFIGNKNT